MSHPSSNFRGVVPATTNNPDEDVDRITESPPASPDANKHFFEQSQLKRADTSSFEEARPFRRADTINRPPPPTQITQGILRSNTGTTLPKYGRHSSQWLFKGWRNIFKMKLDDDHR
ncbi:hypothetical protein K440DRAFT_664523 [Wilcoxina mikolae CBS 423.85]|nr:hypothetical protein K440DRAFT_664523 [Wilcoxina mikolae CBS 423.85]